MWPIVGLIVGALGLLVGIAGWLLPRRLRPRPMWRYITSHELLPADISWLPGLQLLKDGQALSLNAILWRGRFWNSGTDLIRDADLLDSELKLRFPAQVVAARVAESSTPDIKAVGEADGDSVRLNFKFLDVGDGFDLEVIHLGAVQDQPELEGAVVGRGFRRIGLSEPPPAVFFLPTATHLVGLLLAGGLADYTFHNYWLTVAPRPWSGVLALLTAATIYFIFYLLTRPLRRVDPLREPPLWRVSVRRNRRQALVLEILRFNAKSKPADELPVGASWLNRHLGGG